LKKHTNGKIETAAESFAKVDPQEWKQHTEDEEEKAEFDKMTVKD
jgi:hypothetical protein